MVGKFQMTSDDPILDSIFFQFLFAIISIITFKFIKFYFFYNKI